MSPNNFLTRLQRGIGLKRIPWIVEITLVFFFILAINTPTMVQGDSCPREYPPAFDWRSVGGYNFVTPVKNQQPEKCNSCVAFAVAATLEANAKILLNLPSASNDDGKDSIDLSEAQLFFSNTYCSRGWFINGALKYCQKQGVLPESCCPTYKSIMDDGSYKKYEDPEARDNFIETCRCAYKKDKFLKITGFRILSNHQEMKKWISSKAPLIASMCIDDAFLKWKKGLYKCNGCKGPESHFVCIIGYDDIKNAWLCKNSAGTDWGEEGYFWICYDNCGIDDMMFAIEGISITHLTPQGSKEPAPMGTD